ncbi:hypothetical protein CYFUS_007263 [Cystobacter fuscus]|uniref:Pesticidal crystal protein Cry22Aa Ig-like domain-containing protein n=1 Tax=Cystobacter fuscus TaxID=43 RepID=A0A250JDT5_9BACT|nr:hypothetical protein CYFUS_007263 [Cystobacter fuscus]
MVISNPRHRTSSRPGARARFSWHSLMRCAPLLGALAACGPTDSAAPREEQGIGQTARALESTLQASAETSVSTTTPPWSVDAQPTVAVGNGVYLVVWEMEGHDTPDILAVRVRASDGALLDSSPLHIATGSQVSYLPSVAFDGANFLVTWTDLTSSPAIVGARVRASDGALLDTEPLRISPPDFLPQYSPTVTFDGTNYLVFWHGYAWLGQGIADHRLQGIRIRPSDGTRIESASFHVAVNEPAFHAASWGGASLVAWVDGGVKAARVDAAGQVLDTTPLNLSPASATQVRVAARAGEFLVIFNEGSSLKARRVRASDGALLDASDILVGSGAEFPADTGWNSASFSATFDGQDYRVLWQASRGGGRQLRTTRVSSSGTVEAGAEDGLATLHGGSGDWVGIAAQSPSHFLVTYTQYDSSVENNRTRFRLVGPNDCAHDVSPPLVSCPATRRLECTYSGQTTVDMSVDDNCGIQFVSNTPQYFGQPGTWTHSVGAIDLAGNLTSCDTVWTVVDTRPPHLSLNGSTSLSLPYNTPYQEPGATGGDECDGPYMDTWSWPNRIQVSGTVNSQVPGTYPLTYRLTDGAGNTTTATRTVTVLAP